MSVSTALRVDAPDLESEARLDAIRLIGDCDAKGFSYGKILVGRLEGDPLSVIAQLATTLPQITARAAYTPQYDSLLGRITQAVSEFSGSAASGYIGCTITFHNSADDLANTTIEGEARQILAYTEAGAAHDSGFQGRDRHLTLGGGGYRRDDMQEFTQALQNQRHILIELHAKASTDLHGMDHALMAQATAPILQQLAADPDTLKQFVELVAQHESALPTAANDVMMTAPVKEALIALAKLDALPPSLVEVALQVENSIALATVAPANVEAPLSTVESVSFSEGIPQSVAAAPTIVTPDSVTPAAPISPDDTAVSAKSQLAAAPVLTDPVLTHIVATPLTVDMAPVREPVSVAGPVVVASVAGDVQRPVSRFTETVIAPSAPVARAMTVESRFSVAPVYAAVPALSVSPVSSVSAYVFSTPTASAAPVATVVIERRAVEATKMETPAPAKQDVEKPVSSQAAAAPVAAPAAIIVNAAPVTTAQPTVQAPVSIDTKQPIATVASPQPQNAAPTQTAAQQTPIAPAPTVVVDNVVPFKAVETSAPTPVRTQPSPVQEFTTAAVKPVVDLKAEPAPIVPKQADVTPPVDNKRPHQGDDVRGPTPKQPDIVRTEPVPEGKKPLANSEQPKQRDPVTPKRGPDITVLENPPASPPPPPPPKNETGCGDCDGRKGCCVKDFLTASERQAANAKALKQEATAAQAKAATRSLKMG